MTPNAKPRRRRHVVTEMWGTPWHCSRCAATKAWRFSFTNMRGVLEHPWTLDGKPAPWCMEEVS